MLVNTVHYESSVLLQCQLGDHRLGDSIQDLCVLYPADIVLQLQPTNRGNLLRLDHRIHEMISAVRHIAGFQQCVAWQVRLLKMARQGQYVEDARVGVTCVIGNHENRAKAPLHTGSRTANQVCKPYITPLRGAVCGRHRERRCRDNCVCRRRDNGRNRRRVDRTPSTRTNLFHRIKSKPPSVLAFLSFILTSHIFFTFLYLWNNYFYNLAFTAAISFSWVTSLLASAASTSSSTVFFVTMW